MKPSPPPDAAPLMPRPKPKELPKLDPRMESGARSPLGIYLGSNGITNGALARALGMPVRAVQDWAFGASVPSLTAAYEIERVTKGVVPMEAWLGMPQAKKLLATWRAHQTKEVREIPSALDGGGFARPLNKARRQELGLENHAVPRSEYHHQSAAQDRRVAEEEAQKLSEEDAEAAGKPPSKQSVSAKEELEEESFGQSTEEDA